MKELEFLKIINETLTDSSYLGDDCAFLPQSELGQKGLYVTQDTLVEDVHFSLQTITPYDLGIKAISVNLSDLAAVCAVPLYITIGLSCPKNVSSFFIKEFYKGINETAEKFGVKVVGGDITLSDKIFISICAMGKKITDVNISRGFANIGDVVVTTGVHGDSAGGLKLLQKQNKEQNSLVLTHTNPIPQIEKSYILADIATKSFSMMDTSDGLADALYKIAKASDVSIEVDWNLIPINDELKNVFPTEYKQMVLWGGEDYQLLFTLNLSDFEKLPKDRFFKIGNVIKKGNKSIVKIKDLNEDYIIDEDILKSKSFNHFGE